jgi:hypothetical protein
MRPCAALRRFFAAAAALSTAALSTACGAEVAGNAAAVGSLQATQAAQARQAQQQMLDGLKAAQVTGQARAASAGD